MSEKSEKSTGGAAFPSPGVVMQDGRQQGAYNGMSIRDYFAAEAMHGLLASEPSSTPCGANLDDDPTDIVIVARTAYLLADAMLVVRVK